MVHVRVDVDLGLPARLLDGCVGLLRHLRRDEAVLLGEQPEHRPRELRIIRLDVGMDAVEVHRRADARVERGGEERELAAHTEADRTDLRRR